MATPTDLTAARKSRASRGTAQAAKDAAPKPPDAAPAADPKATATPPATPPSETPKANPLATMDIGLVQTPTWKPTAKLSTGEQVACPHSRYGHESEKAALACIRSVIASHGHKLA